MVLPALHLQEGHGQSMGVHPTSLHVPYGKCLTVSKEVMDYQTLSHRPIGPRIASVRIWAAFSAAIDFVPVKGELG